MLNAVFVDVDTAILDEIATDPRVARVVPVCDYELDPGETVLISVQMMAMIGASTAAASELRSSIACIPTIL